MLKEVVEVTLVYGTIVESGSGRKAASSISWYRVFKNACLRQRVILVQCLSVSVYEADCVI